MRVPPAGRSVFPPSGKAVSTPPHQTRLQVKWRPVNRPELNRNCVKLKTAYRSAHPRKNQRHEEPKTDSASARLDCFDAISARHRSISACRSSILASSSLIEKSDRSMGKENACFLIRGSRSSIFMAGSLIAFPGTFSRNQFAGSDRSVQGSRIGPPVRKVNCAQKTRGKPSRPIVFARATIAGSNNGGHTRHYGSNAG